MQWLPTRFYGSLSVYSPFVAQLKIAFGDSCFSIIILYTVLQGFSEAKNVWPEVLVFNALLDC